MEIAEIGVVKNEFTEPKDPDYLRKFESTIEVYDEYVDGLEKIENSEYLQILFYFDRSHDYELIAPRRHGNLRGVFASRSPHRPNSIGSTVVKLLSHEGSMLRVKGLDAINDTPVIDIKPYAPPFDKSTDEKIQTDRPRAEIDRLVKTGDLEDLLLRAGTLHGHYCPFLALGVLAGQFGLKELDDASGDMENLVAVLETNSCFSDGIQYTTGCTFGNNALIYKDYGKTAVTIALRGDRGIRLYYNSEDYLEENYPDRTDLFEKVVKNREGTEEDELALKEAWTEIAFDIIQKPVDELFKIERIKSPDLPDYAPIYDDKYCSHCGEKYMAPKGTEQGGADLCIPCGDKPYLQLDGSGLREIKRRAK